MYGSDFLLMPAVEALAIARHPDDVVQALHSDQVHDDVHVRCFVEPHAQDAVSIADGVQTQVAVSAVEPSGPLSIGASTPVESGIEPSPMAAPESGCAAGVGDSLEEEH